MFSTLRGVAVCAAVIAAPATGLAVLQMVEADVPSPQQLRNLRQLGLDIVTVESTPAVPLRTGLRSAFRIVAVVTNTERQLLQDQGLSVRELGSTALSTRSAYQVFQSFDAPGGIHDQLNDLAKNHPNLVRLHTLGRSVQGRPLYAVEVTVRASDRDDDDDQHHDDDDDGNAGAKPESFFLATHHAREWIAPQMAMRLLKYFVTQFGHDPRITRLLTKTRVWVVPMANPDGYEYSFTNERFWRKNLQDNDGDGRITDRDGVDLNRNFPSQWGRDNEGSSPSLSSGVYRGPRPASEPETQAVMRFLESRARRIKYLVSYHSFSDLILYPWGWQSRTLAPDDPIFVAQAGTDDNAAIYDSLVDRPYDPGVSADLYPTNGEFTDYTYDILGIPSYTVELTSGRTRDGTFYGFAFPDDEAMVQTVFLDNLEFALSLAESALTPARPVSPVGLETADVYHRPLVSSRGSTQDIRVTARRSWEPLWLTYAIDGGPRRVGFFRPVQGQDYNTGPGTHYAYYDATLRGQRPGAQVVYWVHKGVTRLGPFDYTVEAGGDVPVLLVPAQNEPGAADVYTPYYTEALEALGVGYDVWTEDAPETGFQGPRFAEVLSHYELVVWFSGDAFADTLVPQDFQVALRDFINDGGKVIATGQDVVGPAAQLGGLNDDLFQYTFQANVVPEGGLDGEAPATVQGVSGDPIFDGLTLELQGGTGANNQTRLDSLVPTALRLPAFDGVTAAEYATPNAPFVPYAGEGYAYARTDSFSYNRLGGRFTIDPNNPFLRFQGHFDAETNFDFVAVEITDAGFDAWTTVPEASGRTTQDTGRYCPFGGVARFHPFLVRYINDACEPGGDTGTWHAFTGSTGGWVPFSYDLSAYAGREVELHITYITYGISRTLGVFVDEVALGASPVEGFETDLGAFATSTPPEERVVAPWEPLARGAVRVGPAVRTDRTLLLGFGFEAIADARNRRRLLENALGYFGVR